MTYTNGHNPVTRDDGADRDEHERERTRHCGKPVSGWWCLLDRGHDGACAGPRDFPAIIAQHIADSYRPPGLGGDDE